MRKKENVDGQNDQDGIAQISSNRQIGIVIIITALIFLIPLILLLYSNQLNSVHPNEIWNETVTNFANGKLTSTFIGEGIVLTIQLLFVIIGTALLFKTGLKPGTVKKLESKWYWNRILRHILTKNDKKQLWSLYAGYFLIILILTEPVGIYLAHDEKFRQEVRETLNLPLDKITEAVYLFQGTLISIPMITTIILATRLLSRLEIKILESNIGMFLIAIFVSESIVVIAIGYDPLPLYDNMSRSTLGEDDIRGTLVIYTIIFMATMAGVFLDWIIIGKLLGFLMKRFNVSTKS